jgi:acetyl-CoA acetyltransferase
MTPFTGSAERSLREHAYRAGRAALDDAGVAFPSVESVYAGFIWEPTMTGTRFVKEFGLTGGPVQHVENASATGAAAFRESYLSVAGGHAEIAAKNWNHGALNPDAQRRPSTPVTAEKVPASTKISDPLTSMMSAAVGRRRRRDPRHRGVGAPPAPRPAGDLGRGGGAADRALHRPPPVHGSRRRPAGDDRVGGSRGLRDAALGPDDLDLVQVHDAFPIEELVYYELLGLCPDGEGDRLVAEGATKLGGRIPVSTDGGLIGRGHPGGPTGLAQIWETTVQLRGEADERQVDGARVGLCHMVGGGSVCTIHILKRTD